MQFGYPLLSRLLNLPTGVSTLSTIICSMVGVSFAVVLALLGWIGFWFSDPDADVPQDQDTSRSVLSINLKPVLGAAALAWIALTIVPAYKAIAHAPMNLSQNAALRVPMGLTQVAGQEYPQYVDADVSANWQDAGVPGSNLPCLLCLSERSTLKLWFG